MAMISQVSSSSGYVADVAVQPSGGKVAEAKPQQDVAPVESPRPEVKQSNSAPSMETAKKAAEQLNAFMQQFNRDLQFSVDETTGMHIVKVVDATSKEVIRQMPTPEMLAIAKALDKLQGLLIREKA